MIGTEFKKDRYLNESLMIELEGLDRRNELSAKKWLVLKDKRLQITYQSMKKKYDELTAILNKRYSKAIERTNSEKLFLEKLENNTALNVLHSQWIGYSNYDLFFYQLGQKGVATMKGLVIEVDGSIHNHQLKMSQDERKHKALHMLGIVVCVVQNNELNEKTIKKIIANVKSFRRLDHRARQRLLWNVHLYTLICNLPHSELVDFLDIKGKSLAKLNAINKAVNL